MGINVGSVSIGDIMHDKWRMTDFQARVVSPADRAEDIVIDFARILIRALKFEKSN